MSKADVVASMYELAGEAPQPLGPGSKEKKSCLEALGRAVGLDLAGVAGKHECGRRIASRIDVSWDDNCHSGGDTITLVGLERLLHGTQAWLEAEGSPRTSSSSPAPDTSTYCRESVTPPAREEIPVQELQRIEHENSIAESISLLSEPGETPEGVEMSDSKVAPSDVDFATGSWMSHLLSVQSWLHLPVSLVGDDVESFRGRLADALETASTSPDDLFPALDERLERAVALRAEFLADLDSSSEGEATRATATMRWLAAWAESDDAVVDRGGPIHAEAATWPIAQFVQYAKDGELELSPSYQRSEVWPNSDSQLLIESVLRGIPLPSVILLQRSEEMGTSYEVVDGKQRLTALLRFVGQHPRAIDEVRRRSSKWGVGSDELVHKFQNDYPEFKKLWRTHEQITLSASMEKEFHFPFRLKSGEKSALVGDLGALRGKYYCEIKSAVVPVLGEKRKLKSVFEDLSSYRVPVITYTKVTSEQIHEVFSLYNKQGKHLNAEEIRNARFHQLALIKGLLVTAGDSDAVDDVAPFLASSWEELSSVSRALTRYGFTAVGYKRTKVLSWVSALLIHDSEGRLDTKSTAAYIDDMLSDVRKTPGHKLRADETVRDLMLLIDRGLDSHASLTTEVWTSEFKSSQSRSKWQELQLVATLVAFSAAREWLGDNFDDLVDDHSRDITRLAGTWRWKRPEKTQTNIQWQYIADIVGDLLSLFNVPDVEVESLLTERFGGTGLAALRELRGLRKPPS